MLLREKDRQTLLGFFTTINLPIEVWAYGSRVNGTGHNGSDLDLVLRYQNQKPFPSELYVQLCEKIRDSRIPILVELRDWAMLPESFHQNIERQHEVLFDNRSNFDKSEQNQLLNEPPEKYGEKD